MGLLQLKVSVKGVEQLNRGFTGVRAAATDLTSAFQQIADNFRETEESVFAGSGAFQGLTKWSDLSPAYAAYKMMRWGHLLREPVKKKGRRAAPVALTSSLPILTRTYRLRDSLSQQGHPDHIEKINKGNLITGMSLIIGSVVPYGKYHQGPNTGKNIMPVRSPIRLTDQQQRKWISIIRKEVAGQIDLAAAQGKYHPDNYKKGKS